MIILKNIIWVVGCCGVNVVVFRVDVDVVFGIVVVIFVVDIGVVVVVIVVEWYFKRLLFLLICIYIVMKKYFDKICVKSLCYM